MPEPHYADDLVTLHLGDCIDIMAGMPDASVDAVVTDPPYGLEFMGKEWDKLVAPARGRTAGLSHKPTLEHRDDTPQHRAAVRQPSSLLRCCRCGGNSSGAWNRCQCSTPDFRSRSDLGQQMQAWHEAWTAECLRVLKPGGHLLAFGGTRTYHRLACAVEDAGFEIRDSLHWMYGSGFPKSLDVPKAIDKMAGAEREVVRRRTDGRYAYGFSEAASRAGGIMGQPTVQESRGVITAPATEDAARWSGWGTALKPAHEPIVVARKPLAGTVAANVLEWGTGALNVDGCRVGAEVMRESRMSQSSGGVLNMNGRDIEHGNWRQRPNDNPAEHEGRWPPNLLLTHSADCNGTCAPGCPVAGLDGQSGVLTSGANTVKRASGKGKAVQSASIGAESRPDGAPMIFYGDSGGASRFFPVLNWDPEYDLPFMYCAKAPKSERPHAEGVSAHPTVKPLAVMRWLVRLVTPPGGLVLDPFAGTGTTGQACALEGFRCVLAERDPDSAELARVRLAKPASPNPSSSR